METASLQGFKIDQWFLTGNIPYGATVSPKNSLSDLALVSKCLNACGVMLSIRNPPPIILETLKKAGHMLGIDDLIEKFPDHLIGEAFILYMERSGLK